MAYVGIAVVWLALLATWPAPPEPGLHVVGPHRERVEVMLSRAEARLDMEWQGRTLIVEIVPGWKPDKRIGGRDVQRVRADVEDLERELARAVLLSHGVWRHRRQRDKLGVW